MASEWAARLGRPLAIAMWDFSWLERRWPGAGYEDWDRALDELRERGYDAVRIDPYPHLVAVDAGAQWELLPVWTQHDWGAPAPVTVRVQPMLNDFLARCADRGIRVALSSWFRDDATHARMAIASPRRLGAVWAATLDSIEAAGLGHTLLYVDLCNEFPLDLWAPFLYAGDGELPVPELRRWMDESVAVVREQHPRLPYCFSFSGGLRTWPEQDLSFMDLLEPHIWMAHPEMSDFYGRLGYVLGDDRFDREQYQRLVAGGESLYRRDPRHWEERLREAIESAADWSRRTGLPLATTESWAVINYKDWPMLDWGWVKELCELGTHTALATGRWALACTSNFCGPQFTGMWRDVAWHQRLTRAIHDAELPVASETTG